jgi:hypothetical protein
MKTTALMVGLAMGSAVSALAQGPFQFTSTLTLLEPHPPNTERWGGSGTFSLASNTFTYRVEITPWGPAPEAEVHSLSLDGPVLFNLALLGCQTGFDTNLGFCVFRGSVVIPDSGVPDLMANN